MAHWSEQKEKGGGFWQFRLMLGLYRIFGLRFFRLCLHPVVAVFWLASPAARRTSRQFLERVARAAALAGAAGGTGSAGGLSPGAATAPPRRVRHGEVYRHLYTFACSLIEKLAAWSGDESLADVEVRTPDAADLVATLNSGSGALLICSHLGNTEVMRSRERMAGLPVNHPVGVTSVVDFSGTANFNRLLAEVNPAAMTRLVSSRDVGPDTVVLLEERIAAGDMVVIAGDRTAPDTPGRSARVSFLGGPAWFPQGAFVLASLLGAPVYFIFVVRASDRDPDSPYGFHVHRARVEPAGSRRERAQMIQKLVEEYVSHLERLCIEHPFQWYNFFDFWTDPAAGRPSMGDS